MIVNRDGHVVAYMGDDERFDYLYRFVSRDNSASGGRPCRRHNKSLLSRGRPVGGEVHRRRPRGRRQRRHRGVDSATATAGPRPGFSSRRCSSSRGSPPTRCSRPRWTAPRTSSPTWTTAGSTSPAPTTPTAASPARRARPSPTRAAPTRTATSSRSSRSGGDHTAPTFSWNLMLICGDPATAGTYFGGYRERSRRSRAPTTSRSTATATCGSRPTASRRRCRSATGCSRSRSGPERGRVSAVPRRARRRRDLRSGGPRPGRLGVRRGPAPRRGGHLGRPAVALPRLRPRRRHRPPATSPARGPRSCRSPAAAGEPRPGRAVVTPPAGPTTCSYVARSNATIRASSTWRVGRPEHLDRGRDGVGPWASRGRRRRSAGTQRCERRARRRPPAHAGNTSPGGRGRGARAL